MNFNNLVDSVLNEQSVIQAPFHSGSKPITTTTSSPKPFSPQELETLARTFQDVALKTPVSYRTKTADGMGTSYGGGVTLDSIVRRAQNSLRSLGQNPKDKQSILTHAANSLQDWAVGMNQDSGVPEADRIDDQTRDRFMDSFANLNNVEKFIGAINLPNQPVQQPKPVMTAAQKEEDKELTDLAWAYYDKGSSLYKQLRDPKTLQDLQRQDPMYYNKLMQKIKDVEQNATFEPVVKPGEISGPWQYKKQ